MMICRSLFSPSQRYRVHPASFAAISALPVPVRCRCRLSDLYVMTCGAVQQGLTSLSGEFSPWSTITVLPGVKAIPPAADDVRLSAHRTAVHPASGSSAERRSAAIICTSALLQGHHCQFSHPLTLPGCTALPDTMASDGRSCARTLTASL